MENQHFNFPFSAVVEILSGNSKKTNAKEGEPTFHLSFPYGYYDTVREQAEEEEEELEIGILQIGED